MPDRRRGRRGKPWFSPFGCQLILSMYRRLEQGMAAAMGLSLAVGVAVVEALESLGYRGVELPNGRNDPLVLSGGAANWRASWWR